MPMTGQQLNQFINNSSMFSYSDRQQANNASMQQFAAEAEARRALESPCGLGSTCKPDKSSWTNAQGIPSYLPPTFDPRLTGAASQNCFDSPDPTSCNTSKAAAQRAVAQATAADKTGFDSFVAQRKAEALERNTTTPAQRAAAANPVARAAAALAAQTAAVDAARATASAFLAIQKAKTAADQERHNAPVLAARAAKAAATEKEAANKLATATQTSSRVAGQQARPAPKQRAKPKPPPKPKGRK